MRRTAPGVLLSNELQTDSHDAVRRKQIIRVYETLRRDRSPQMAQRMIAFLKKQAARKDLRPRSDTRNGRKTMVELTKKLNWPTPMMWSKGELETLGTKWQEAPFETRHKRDRQ